ncbi:MAG: DUF4348 domain-containing protein [Bacteroidaceae bacterium]|nr:DUF4348 domain-containing protein [Bacteroidaceae bacterium]
MKSKSVSLLPLLVAIATWISCDRGRTQPTLGGAGNLEIEDTTESDTVLMFEDDNEGLSLEDNETEVFGDFIFAFTHNARFQASRVRFPLPSTEIDGTEDTLRSGRQFREAFQLPGNDYYTMLLGQKEQMEVFQNDSTLTEVDFQCMSLPGQTMVNYKFRRTDGRWFLHSRQHTHVNANMLDFMLFYERFVTDSLFQQESVARELAISMEDPDGEMGGIEGIIEADQWPMFRPEMPAGRFVNLYFGQAFPHPDRLYLYQCGISNGMLDIFTFRRRDGQWKLTAYEN